MYSATLGTARALAAACLLTLLACTQSNTPTSQPKDLRTSSETDVRAAVESFKIAISKRNIDKILGFYAVDGWLLPPSGRIARTDAERRVLWTQLEALPVSQDAIDVEDRIDVAESGDLAVQYGEFRQVMADGSGNVRSIPQKFVTCWRRQPDGSWKISASMATIEY